MSAESEAQKTLQSRARLAIHNSGLAQREVGRSIGIDETKLSKSLKGTRRFHPDELATLAAVTGVTVNWLVSGADDTAGPTVVPSAKILPTRHRETDKQAQRRRNIVETSWWLFAENGFASVRIADIAKACNISNAAVHYYFHSKSEIFAETLRYSVKLAFDRQVAELHSITDPTERLKKLMAIQLPEGQDGRAEFSIWLQMWSEVAVGAASRENHAQGYRRWLQTVHDVIIEGRQSGSFNTTAASELAGDLTSVIDGMGIKVLTGLLTVDQMKSQVHNFIDRNIVKIEGTPK